ncbi:conserved Plasmodium protein, unknown function [Plasmodium knowlesi strain H]|uniref:Uncharacterized protein n=3 Tax=Plasmodium knowlesi TaxID=5850 RepID=A0A5K1U8N7_PLAKH|nr:conserved Plasmodium protein, unknown function [Plasmodium knowlesi strain H]OTN67460.1 Uncharacterized protein PKNOH_S06415600 [Plasmodium knowlesi]CAA9987430.1 conserved Plasmodium protein, unknown function [Plasmodium knowlesi strain H]SBO23264.1 conserved Plasmodium protein, unknown function [Plasmodium knowlesi strain H]SBO24213.1 conserved Plasmodium protein, unknown function [Plasmodium knowlesi strain H]VVS76904.1 conserved Plasmodium protein, unknown function [Plasmodium knowlesi s|eukprot:XP_002258431.1 hypothetical protein, conserved in Plasmodium species [Plasmodium knowlesi strain H]
MMPRSENQKEEEEWELHPLFLSKIPNKKDIDKNPALSALITLINEEEEKEVFSYEPRRKNLKKKITEKGQIIYKKDRRNLYEPYQQNKNDKINYFEKKNFGGNADISKEEEVLDVEMDEEGTTVTTAEQGGDHSSQNVSNNQEATDQTSIGEVLVCLSMMNLKQ